MKGLPRSPGLAALGAATVVVWAPLAALLVGSAVASALDCRVDEGSVHPCVVAGIDIGHLLYLSLVSGWLILGLWPIMLLTLLLWFGVCVRAVIRRFRAAESR